MRLPVLSKGLAVRRGDHLQQDSFGSEEPSTLRGTVLPEKAPDENRGESKKDHRDQDIAPTEARQFVPMRDSGYKSDARLGGLDGPVLVHG